MIVFFPRDATSSRTTAKFPYFHDGVWVLLKVSIPTERLTLIPKRFYDGGAVKTDGFSMHITLTPTVALFEDGLRKSLAPKEVATADFGKGVDVRAVEEFVEATSVQLSRVPDASATDMITSSFPFAVAVDPGIPIEVAAVIGKLSDHVTHDATGSVAHTPQPFRKATAGGREKDAVHKLTRNEQRNMGLENEKNQYSSLVSAQPVVVFAEDLAVPAQADVLALAVETRALRAETLVAGTSFAGELTLSLAQLDAAYAERARRVPLACADPVVFLDAVRLAWLHQMVVHAPGVAAAAAQVARSDAVLAPLDPFAKRYAYNRLTPIERTRDRTILYNSPNHSAVDLTVTARRLPAFFPRIQRVLSAPDGRRIRLGRAGLAGRVFRRVCGLCRDRRDANLVRFFDGVIASLDGATRQNTLIVWGGWEPGGGTRMPGGSSPGGKAKRKVLGRKGFLQMTTNERNTSRLCNQSHNIVEKAFTGSDVGAGPARARTRKTSPSSWNRSAPNSAANCACDCGLHGRRDGQGNVLDINGRILPPPGSKFFSHRDAVGATNIFFLLVRRVYRLPIPNVFAAGAPRRRHWLTYITPPS